MAKSYQHTRKKREYATIEIEKLKAEIDKLEMFYLYSKDDLISKKEVFEIIDKHISELKGENNESNL